MKDGMLSNADGVLEKKRRRQKWKRLGGVLGCLVVIGTAYVLMRPANTLERELICGMEEHQHSIEQGCYQEIAAVPPRPICDWEEGETGHAHSDECYGEESVLTCTEPEGETHQHNESCYTTERILTCNLPEVKNHTHTAECYLPVDEDAETEWELICNLSEHTHTEECYTNEAAKRAQVEEVAALIDALPGAEEVKAKMAELLAAEDTEGYYAYCTELAQQMEQANTAYETLTDEQKAQLNIAKLTALYVDLSAPATESGIVVTISGKMTSLPCPVEELTLTATEVENENANALLDQALEDEELTAAKNYMLDIKLMRGEEEVQPIGPITVTFMGLPLAGDAEVTLADDGTADDLDDSDTEPVVYQTRKLAAQTFAVSAAGEKDITATAADDVNDIDGQSYATKPKVYQIDGNTQQATELDVAVNDDNNVVLETYRLANLYSVSLLAAAENVTVVTNSTELIKACEAGGTVVVGADISTFTDSIVIKDGTNTTLDLNGYKVYTNDTAFGRIFEVQSGSSLTIMDSTANADGTSKYETKSKRSGITYGTSKAALATITSNQLTYYVVESSETDPTKHLTTETQWKRVVPLGGGKAGAIVGRGTVSDGQSAIYVNGGTVTIKGGYICNFGNATRPGDEKRQESAVRVSGGGTLYLEGGVLAANRNVSGGAIDIVTTSPTKESKFVMTGGIISGNFADKLGGGIYCKGYDYGTTRALITMSGGYITCNSANTDAYTGSDRIGGGGVFVGYSGSFTMTGGYVTGNFSKWGGCGIFASQTPGNVDTSGGKTPKIMISNGYISANRTLKEQGAGICSNYGSECIIKSENGGKIYITNNRAEEEDNFSGGGIYNGHDSTLYLYNALISENTAKHIGGGLSTCYISNTFLYVNNGAAIFDNHDGGADGKPRSANSANEVRNYEYTGLDGNPDPYPISEAGDGHQDIYCSGYTKIYAAMLGGGDPKWSGSRDGSRFTLTKADQYCTSNIIIGLTAHPSEADKEKARNAASVYITGNYSARYGGGVMSNGTVYFGDPEGTTLPTRLIPVGKKSFLKPDGKTAAAIADGRFKVTITNTQNASEVYTGTVDASGNLTFPTILFTQEGTYTYKIKEVADALNIAYDTTTYTMTVTVNSATQISNLGGTTTKYAFPTTVKVINDATKQEVFSSNNVHNESTVILRSDTSNGAAFTNKMKGEEYTLNITKEDQLTGNTLSGAMFKLQFWTMDPRPVGEGKAGTGQERYVEVYCVPISAGVYRYVGYSWNVPSSASKSAVREFVTDDNGNIKFIGLPAGDFRLKEMTAPDGYLIAAEWNKWNDFTLNATSAPSGTYAVTVADPPIPYTFQFHKVSAEDHTTPVPNAKFQLLDSTGAAMKFVMKGAQYQYSVSGTISELVTDNNGEIQITELPPGDYTLHETKAPDGFSLAADYPFTLSLATTENRVFTYTQEEPVAYELPETGGPGAKIFAISGAVLLVGAASLMLRRDKRGKGDTLPDA